MVKTPHLSDRRSRFAFWAILGIGGALILGLAFTSLHIAKPSFSSPTKSVVPTSQPSPSGTTPPSTSSGLLAAQGPNVISDIVQQVGPAVVRIDSTRTVSAQPSAGLFNDPFFQQFFGSQMPQSQQPEQQIERGEGSGFITNSNGRIITNAHVVDGSDTVQVTLKDGRTFTGKVLGSDPVTDVAVVSVDAKDLPTVALGDSDQVLPGSEAIAIGNPLGLDNTVTAGIISATSRSSSLVGVPDKRIDFLQTDAAINPGNSGGPLLNAQGQVIGMNTAIIQGAQGLGFAIPVNTVKRISDRLAKGDKIEHAYLGIQMATLTPELKEKLNSDPNSGISVNEDQGVLVYKVVPNSPAAKAGVRAGDVIHQVGGQPVTTDQQLLEKVEASSVNDNLSLTLDRNGQSQNISVRLQALPAAASSSEQPG